jgi:CRISPR-associated protein Cmr4
MEFESIDGNARGTPEKERRGETAVSWYEQYRNYYLCLDPVHVGAGGYRLGRVDNSIVREPGTGMPKVPGTSLSGAARSYAAMTCGRIDAAGQQSKVKIKDYLKCPILYTFGTASDEVGQSKAGAVSIADAHILFFPVASTDGPLWVTTLELLRRAGLALSRAEEEVEKLLAGEGKAIRVANSSPKEIAAGWLRFEVAANMGWASNGHCLKECGEWSDLKERVLIVNPKMMGVLVNSNLEVRTSVSINPQTGAAEEKLLFTYEAIPRATWLFGDVVVDDYMKAFPTAWDGQTEELKNSWTGPKAVAQTGARLMEYLGVGGMGTRGFGRMKLTAEESVHGGKS